MKTRNALLAIVIVLGLADVVMPIPILAIILTVVLIERPRWFLSAVRRVYRVED